MRLVLINAAILMCVAIWGSPARAVWFQDINSPEIHGSVDDATICAAWGDYNNDGLEDLFLANVYEAGAQCHLLENNGDGSFDDVTAAAGVANAGKTPWGCCWGDFNSDGYLDLYISNNTGSQNSNNVLFQNLGPNGGGQYTFQEVQDTDLQDAGTGQGAIWGDFDNDGLLDIYLINTFASSCQMLKNDGGGNFSRQTCAPADNFYAQDATASDFDNDGDLDIYLICRYYSQNIPNQFFRNNGGFSFDEEAHPSGIALDSVISKEATTCDYDFDGDLDLYVLAQQPEINNNVLFRNDGVSGNYIQFTNVTSLAGLSAPANPWGSAWSDFDLDGDMDLFIAKYEGDRMYQSGIIQEEEPWFDDVTIDAGVDDGGWGHCSAWADFNIDGKPDLFLGNATVEIINDELNKLFKNNYPISGNRYLNIILIGCESNRSGVGAQITVSYQVLGQQEVDQLVEISGGGHGNHSQPSLPAEFGCGQALSVDVLVAWPSGDTSFFEDVATNQRITVVEHGTFSDHDMVWDYGLYGHYYISGDVTIQNIEVQIVEGTHVYFHKTWRTNIRPKLLVSTGGSLAALGTVDKPVVFTSQYSAPAEGDWEGLYTMLSANSIWLEFAQVSYANYGLYGLEYLMLAPGSLDVTNCRFTSLEKAGIDLGYPSINTPTEIRNCYFEDCGTYGIRVRKDIFNNDLDVIIEADTILDCKYGIYYVGNSNLGYTKRPLISNCVIWSPGPPATQGYGIFVSTFSAASPLVSPWIQGDSIVGFYGGISLTNVNSNCILVANKVKSNIDYGLYLKYASPNIVPSMVGNPNVFNSSYIGIYCDKYSSPYVRTAKIKENQYRGVLVDAATPPDFGTASSYGWNSIHTRFSMFQYADMEYTQTLPQLNAVGNWWGERVPDPSEIIGNVDYSPWLDSDPLPGYEKKEEWFVDLPDDLGLSQNFPNPFNPATEISFYIPEACFAGLKVYNLNGQLVKVLVAEHLEAGEHSVVWDGRNSESEDVASGIYFYVLSTDHGKDSKTMTLLR